MLYLTAQSALSIPNESNHFIDWHLQEAFGGSPDEWQARCTWVGLGLGRRALDTKPWLGDTGIWDATDVLVRHGVAVRDGERVWAARPWRAILDMVLTHADKGRVAQHICLKQWFDPVDDAEQLRLLFQATQTHLTALPHKMRMLLNQWLALQTEVIGNTISYA